MAMHLARVMPTQRDQRLDGPHPLHEDNDATWLNDLMRHQQIISHDIRGRDAEKVSHDWQASGPRRENTIPARRGRRSSAVLGRASDLPRVAPRRHVRLMAAAEDWLHAAGRPTNPDVCTGGPQ